MFNGRERTLQASSIMLRDPMVVWYGHMSYGLRSGHVAGLQGEVGTTWGPKGINYNFNSLSPKP